MAPPRKLNETTTRKLLAEISSCRSLRSVCEDEGMPDKATVMRELAVNPDFAAAYTAACGVRLELLMDELIDIADDGTNDWMDRQVGKDTIRVQDPETAARSKLRIEARKWIAAVTQPKKYGTRVALEHNVVDGLAERLERARKRVHGISDDPALPLAGSSLSPRS